MVRSPQSDEESSAQRKEFEYLDETIQQLVKHHMKLAVLHGKRTRGLSQAQIARHIGNSPSQFHKKLNSEKGYPIPLMEVKAIAELCVYSLAPLLEESEDLKSYFESILEEEVPLHDGVNAILEKSIASYLKERQGRDAKTNQVRALIDLTRKYLADGADLTDEATVREAIQEALEAYALSTL